MHGTIKRIKESYSRLAAFCKAEDFEKAIGELSNLSALYQKVYAEDRTEIVDILQLGERYAALSREMLVKTSLAKKAGELWQERWQKSNEYFQAWLQLMEQQQRTAKEALQFSGLLKSSSILNKRAFVKYLLEFNDLDGEVKDSLRMYSMKLNRQDMEKTLKELEARDDYKKGMQPEMLLSCFLSHGREDDRLCRECRRYDSCRITLEAYKQEEELFKK